MRCGWRTGAGYAAGVVIQNEKLCDQSQIQLASDCLNFLRREPLAGIAEFLNYLWPVLFVGAHPVSSSCPNHLQTFAVVSFARTRFSTRDSILPIGRAFSGVFSGAALAFLSGKYAWRCSSSNPKFISATNASPPIHTACASASRTAFTTFHTIHQHTFGVGTHPQSWWCICTLV